MVFVSAFKRFESVLLDGPGPLAAVRFRANEAGRADMEETETERAAYELRVVLL